MQAGHPQRNARGEGDERGVQARVAPGVLLAPGGEEGAEAVCGGCQPPGHLHPRQAVRAHDSATWL